MGLQEHGGFVKRIHLLPLLLLFLSHDLGEGVSSSLLGLTLLQLLLNLGQLVFLILKIGTSLISLTVLIAHVSVVDFKSNRELGVRIVEVSSQFRLILPVLLLDLLVLAQESLTLSIQSFNSFLVAFLLGVLDSLTLGGQLVL